MAAKQAAWLFTLLVSLACSGWYFARSTSFAIKLDAHTLSTTNDMSIYDLTVHQFTSEGHLANYLKSPLMHHTPEKNTHWLQSPHIIITQENQPPWEIDAEEATTLYGGKEITFNKNVIIHQNKDKNGEESLFKTQSITYFPQDKFATTPLDVTYERAGSRVQAKGMHAYLAEKRVKLLSQARGRYVPNHG